MSEYDEWKAEMTAREDEYLAKGLCPYSGERLLPAEIDAWERLSRFCSMCDCFGYDPHDPRIQDRCDQQRKFHANPHKGCLLR